MGTTKVCISCGCEKELNSGFYAHAKMADGYLNHCKECVKSRVKVHRAENDHVREYDRNRYYHNEERREYARQQRKRWAEKNREKLREHKKNWIEKNPEKRKTHIIVRNAIRSKKLIKTPCVVCGNSRSEAHHEDYSKPLEVIWLCRTHHAERHRQYESR